jgi:hypothetical protein
MSNVRRISCVFLLINQARWFLEKLEIDFNWLSIPHLLVRDLNLLNLQVYLTLCCALVASAAGAYLHILWNIGGLLTTIACFGCMAWLLSISPYEEVVLFGLFYGFFFSVGCSPYSFFWYWPGFSSWCLCFLLFVFFMSSKRGLLSWWQLHSSKGLLSVLWLIWPFRLIQGTCHLYDFRVYVYINIGIKQ